MKKIERIHLNLFIGLVISLSSILFFYICSFKIYELFTLNCTNKDYLTWDPELRYIITLKMMNYLRDFNLIQFFLLFFDSPHWPSLRNVIESFIFLSTYHSPTKVIMLTYFSFLFIPVVLFLIMSLLHEINITFGLIYAFMIISLLQADSLWLYSLTGMLELQGALLFPIVSYIVWKSLSDIDFINKKRNGWLAFSVTFLLYQTKYPYGYMLVLFLAIFQILFFTRTTWEFGLDYLKSMKIPYKKPFLLLAIMLLIVLLLFKSSLPGKVPGYITYSIVLFCMIDFFVYFFKNNSTEKSHLRFIIQWIFFPIIIWILIQPDRFGSYSGQISHVETQGFNPGQKIDKNLDYLLVFFTEFIFNAYREFHVSYIILIGNALIFLWGVYEFHISRKLNFGFFLSSISLITIIELSLFTSNRLARHTYHLYPTMLLGISIFILSLKPKFKQIPILLSVGLLVVVSFPFVTSPLLSLSKTEICYTGYDKNDYKLPEWIRMVGLEKLNKNTILFNEVNPLHVNKADAEYVLFKISYDKKIILLVDPKRSNQYKNNFEEIWIISNNCKESERLNSQKNILTELGFAINEVEEIKNEFGCIRIVKK
jgi:hypothetical protein